MDTEIDTSRHILGVIAEETARVQSSTVQAIRTSAAGVITMGLAVALMLEKGIDDTAILAFFNKDANWLQTHRTMAMHFAKQPTYKRIASNVAQRLIDSVMSGDAVTGSEEPVTTTTETREEPTSSEVVSPSPICEAVLDVAEEYFGIDRDNLIQPKNPDDQEAQDKCVKAMLQRNASRLEIWNTFGIPVGNNQWIDEINDRVTDDDGDLYELTKEPREESDEEVEEPEPVRKPAAQKPVTQVTESKTTMRASQTLEKIAEILGRDIVVLKTDESHDVTPDRYVAMYAMDIVGHTADDIAAEFGQSRPNFYRSRAKVNDRPELKKRAESVAKQLQGGAAASRATVTQSTKPTVISNQQSNKETKQTMTTKQAVAALALQLNTDVTSLKNGTDRETTANQKIVAHALRAAGHKGDDIGPELGRDKTWYYNACCLVGKNPDWVARSNNLLKKLSTGSSVSTQAPKSTQTPPRQVEAPRVPVPQAAPSKVPVSSNGYSGKSLEIAEKVHRVLCPSNLFLMEQSAVMAAVAEGRDVSIFVAKMQLPTETVASDFHTTVDEVYRVFGKLTIRMDEDAAFAKKIKQIVKS